jgi:hypothetical protein
MRRRQIPIVWILAGLLTGACASVTAEQPRKVVASAARCNPLSASQQQWLTSEWQPFLAYTRACPIHDSKQETVLLLVSVQATPYYKAQPGQSVRQVEFPRPLLFSPSGALWGSLPYSFPDDPPAELRVTFTRWEHDFPQKIELYLTDPRASGDRSLPPMVWDPSQKRFLSR